MGSVSILPSRLSGGRFSPHTAPTDIRATCRRLPGQQTRLGDVTPQNDARLADTASLGGQAAGILFGSWGTAEGAVAAWRSSDWRITAGGRYRAEYFGR